MTLFEKGVFAALGTSISIGIFQLATSPWGEAGSSSANEEGVSFGKNVKSFLMSACPVKFDDKSETKIEPSKLDDKRGARSAEGTKVDFGR